MTNYEMTMMKPYYKCEACGKVCQLVEWNKPLPEKTKETCDYYLLGNCLINSGTKKAWKIPCEGVCNNYIPEPTPPEEPEKTCLNCWNNGNSNAECYGNGKVAQNCNGWQPKPQEVKVIEPLDIKKIYLCNPSPSWNVAVVTRNEGLPELVNKINEIINHLTQDKK